MGMGKQDFTTYTKLCTVLTLHYLHQILYCANTTNVLVNSLLPSGDPLKSGKSDG